MNEVGQVIAWQLTKSTSIDEVHNLLQNVAGRLHLESSTLFPIYVDNCCLLRQKLLHSIGPNIVIKLDLFHAVQRITKTLPKRHPFFHQCVDELKLVFRQTNDLGRKRTAPTPDAECISKNIDDFVKKWDKCLHQEWKLVQDILYQHNCKIHEKITGKSCEPLPLLRKEATGQIAMFGVTPKDYAIGKEHWLTSKLGCSIEH